jgi:predicted ATPase/DNA-binding winged helix-turn-helix (wHTH) protein
MPPAAPALQFGRFELQPHERRLLVGGHEAPLGARAFDLLLALAERPGQLVDKATLMDLVWPGLVVQENNLAAQASALRKVLGDDVIATIPGRGYRFVARVEAAPPPVREGLAHERALRTNLPAELPALLGRDDELAELGASIAAHRLVTVAGAGGIGKSLLVQHVLAARRETYRHGVCWIELAEVVDAGALPATVAAALGLQVGAGDALAALVSAVSSLDVLLALDNAEHLLDDVARLCLALHDAAPGVRLVVTSQAPLRLAPEQVFRVGPLAVPAEPLAAPDALRFGAVALFAARARAIDHRFDVTDADVGLVVDICRVLDGLPLAIELAAARAPVLGLPALQASLRDRFAVLTHGRNRAAPQRQRTLRSALEWSCALLAPREQQAFRRLGVVVGSASLALVQQVLRASAGGEVAAWDVLDMLDTLVDRSLVAVAISPEDEQPRYRLLETPRAHALELLEQAGEVEAVKSCHAHAVAAMFDAAYDELFDGRIGVDAWLRRCERDLDNARDALRWAHQAGDTAVALRIATTMLRALPRSLHAERMALARDVEAAIVPDVPEALRLKAWIELGCVLADSQKARGRHAADEALVLARRLAARDGDRFPLYHALCRAASAAAQCGDLAAAASLLEESQRIEDPSWPAQRLLWGAEAAQWLARMSGDTAEALHRGRRLLALDRRRGSFAALAMGNVIDAELAAGDAHAAARHGMELIADLRGTRQEYDLACARVNLLAALMAQSDTAPETAFARDAWAKAAAFDLQHAAAAYLALFCALDGRPRDAVLLAAYSEAIYAARGEAREANETAATTRALSLARRGLDAATVERLRGEGARLCDADVASLAFAGAGQSAAKQ